MKFVRYALLALAFLAPAAHAAHWRLSPADSDAFIKAYAYPVMRALMEEGLDLKVKSGKVSPSLAACLKQHMRLDALLVPMRPFVAHTFTSSKRLRRATAFFNSPAGVKQKAYLAQVWRESLREVSGAPPRPGGEAPQLETTPQEAAVAARFWQSPAGKEFQNFELAGTPALGAVDVFGAATDRCAQQVKR